MTVQHRNVAKLIHYDIVIVEYKIHGFLAREMLWYITGKLNEHLGV